MAIGEETMYAAINLLFEMGKLDEKKYPELKKILIK